MYQSYQMGQMLFRDRNRQTSFRAGLNQILSVKGISQRFITSAKFRHSAELVSATEAALNSPLDWLRIHRRFRLEGLTHACERIIWWSLSVFTSFQSVALNMGAPGGVLESLRKLVSKLKCLVGGL